MEVSKLLNECIEIHDRKSHDYASDNDKHSNFKFIENFHKLFYRGEDERLEDVHLPYLSLIGVKLARIKELMDGKTPNNESLKDSFQDLINYIALWQERICE